MLLTGDTEVLYQNVSDYHFIHHKLTGTDPGSNTGLRCERPTINCHNKGLAFPDYKKGMLFSIHCSPIFERALLYGRSPGFARLSFW